MKTYTEQATEKFNELQALRAELEGEKIQHKRTALSAKVKLVGLEYSNLSLRADNENLKNSALATAMASKVEMANWTKQNAEDSIRGEAKNMIYRLTRLAENLEADIASGRYDDMIRHMTSDLPVIIGNSSFDSLTRYASERAIAMKLLEIANPEQE